jgi:NAD(P)-dependent dehydrogenase (short-subunit alcohol dehydrogenase family)
MVDLASSSLEKAVATLSSEDKGNCELVVADVTSEKATEGYVAKALERWGRLDISVQNAGIASDRVSILETDTSLWERTMSVNALGGIFYEKKWVEWPEVDYTLRSVLRNQAFRAAMIKNPGGASGSIVVVSSQLGLEGTHIDVHRSDSC